MKKRLRKPIRSRKADGGGHLKAFARRHPEFIREFVFALSSDLSHPALRFRPDDAHRSDGDRTTIFLIK